MSDNSIQINVGKQIQKLREFKGLSQQELAAKCNFEKSVRIQTKVNFS